MISIVKIPADLVASVSGIALVAVIYLARAISKLAERVAHLEGQLNHKEKD